MDALGFRSFSCDAHGPSVRNNFVFLGQQSSIGLYLCGHQCYKSYIYMPTINTRELACRYRCAKHSTLGSEKLISMSMLMPIRNQQHAHALASRATVKSMLANRMNALNTHQDIQGQASQGQREGHKGEREGILAQVAQGCQQSDYREGGQRSTRQTRCLLDRNSTLDQTVDSTIL